MGYESGDILYGEAVSPYNQRMSRRAGPPDIALDSGPRRCAALSLYPHSSHRRPHSMPRPLALTFATLLGVPEVRPALAAVREVLGCVCSPRPKRGLQPPLPPRSRGRGENAPRVRPRPRCHPPQSWARRKHASDRRSRSPRAVLGRGYRRHRRSPRSGPAHRRGPATPARRFCTIPSPGSSTNCCRDRYRWCSPHALGPRRLDLPTRLTSRLASGLVSAVEAPGIDSRRTILADKAGASAAGH